MDEKGEDYIILIGDPAKLKGAGVCLGSECLIITTRMVEKGEDYITIILIGAPEKLWVVGWCDGAG